MIDDKNGNFPKIGPDSPFEKGGSNSFPYEETTTRVRKGDDGPSNDVPMEPKISEPRETSSSE